MGRPMGGSHASGRVNESPPYKTWHTLLRQVFNFSSVETSLSLLETAARGIPGPLILFFLRYFPALCLFKRFQDRPDGAGHYFFDIGPVLFDAMVSDAILREIVGADF